MKELNKKLAEWAGFIFDEGAEYGIPPILGLWYAPDNNQIGYPELPQFTQSLDACFKWLVPKVVGGDSYTVDIRTEKYQTWVHLIAHYYMDKSYDTQDKEPALALCLAIEKLIDGEK